MKRNLPLAVLCTLCVIATLFAGNWYWNRQKGDFFRRLYGRGSFSLLDGDGKIFNTHDLPANQKVLFVFTPDGIPVSAVKPFRVFVKEIEREEEGKLQLVVVSRVHKDIVKNFLRAARFHGRLLLDPSGGLGRYLGARDSLESTHDWTVVLSDHDLKVTWSSSGKEVPSFKDLSKKL